MNHLKNFVFLFFAAIIFISCSNNSKNQPWIKAIHKKVPFVIIPSENARLDSTLASKYGSFLGEFTATDIDLVAKVDSTLSSPAGLDAVVLYPGAGHKLSTVWITRAPSGAIQTLKEAFYKDFSQNNYQFNDNIIHRLHVNDRIFFAARISDMLLLSQSSLSVEEALRAYTGKAPRIDADGLSIQPNHIILNTPALDSGLRQLAQVRYHPVTKNAFQGTGPTMISFQQNGKNFQLSGRVPLKNSNDKSTLVKAVTETNASITLDQYISSNAAGFGLFRQAPLQSFPEALTDTTRLDRHLMNERELFSSIANHMKKRFALAVYAESGFLTEGEQIYLRKLSDPAGLQKKISTLADENLIVKEDSSYYIQSNILSGLFGGPLSTFSGFYLRITDDITILSKRKELIETVISDKNRRRTMYYEPEFRQIKASLPEKVSSLFVTSQNFRSFLDPFLIPESYAQPLLSKFDMLSISTVLSEDQSELNLHISNHSAKKKVNVIRNSGSINFSPNSPGNPY